MGLLRLAAALGDDLGAARGGAEVLAQAPFSSERKRMTTAVVLGPAARWGAMHGAVPEPGCGAHWE